jgi:hypothetical protein
VKNDIVLGAVDGGTVLGFLTALGTVAVLAEEGRDVTLRWLPGSRRAVLRAGGITDGRALAHLLCHMTHRDPPGVSPAEKMATTALLDRARALKLALAPGARRAKLEVAAPELLAEIEGLEEPEALGRIARAHARAAALYRSARMRAVPDPAVSLGRTLDCSAEEYGVFCRDAAEQVKGTGAKERRLADFAAAYGSMAGGEFGATPLCLVQGSGHQNFLETPGKLMTLVEPEDFEVALLEGTVTGKWAARERMSLRYEPWADRRHARMSEAPSSVPSLSLWAANLLAWNAVRMFPCLPGERRVRALGWREVEGRWRWRWPLWEPAVGADVIRSVLGLPGLWDGRGIRELGVTAVFETERYVVGEPPLCKTNLAVPKCVA